MNANTTKELAIAKKTWYCIAYRHNKDFHQGVVYVEASSIAAAKIMAKGQVVFKAMRRGQHISGSIVIQQVNVGWIPRSEKV